MAEKFEQDSSKDIVKNNVVASLQKKDYSAEQHLQLQVANDAKQKKENVFNPEDFYNGKESNGIEFKTYSDVVANKDYIVNKFQDAQVAENKLDFLSRDKIMKEFGQDFKKILADEILAKTGLHVVLSGVDTKESVFEMNFQLKLNNIFLYHDSFSEAFFGRIDIFKINDFNKETILKKGEMIKFNKTTNVDGNNETGIGQFVGKDGDTLILQLKDTNEQIFVRDYQIIGKIKD